ncbi:MAG: ATP-dependent helicase [Lachnospiraceae bacterium]|nr:ATP-dependent helicase [Lachnospiraceae bacterium]
MNAPSVKKADQSAQTACAFRHTAQSALLVGLNDEQRRAVTHEEGSAALVIAGAGAGKTTVILQRILYIIHIQKIPPEKILVVTFTKDAARSMQKRFGEKIAEDPAIASCPVNFGTFHSVFYQILLQSHRYTNSAMLSQVQKTDLMCAVLRRLGIFASAQQLSQLAAQCLEAVSYYKNTRDEARAKRMLPSECGERQFRFGQLFDLYKEACTARNKLDFDDMLYDCLTLFDGDPAFAAYWQNRFSHILIDEFQDINPMQYELITRLASERKAVFAVGDEDQSIYGFRGSKPACMKQFFEEWHAKLYRLEANYRSTAEIVACSDQVIAQNKGRFLQDKRSYAAGDNANLQDSVRLIGFETRKQQLDYLQERLRQLAQENERADVQETCGVLFRTNGNMQSLAVQLTKRGIPFVMKEKWVDPYSHFVAKDVMTYLKLAGDPQNRTLLLGVLNRPKRQIPRELFGEWDERRAAQGDWLRGELRPGEQLSGGKLPPALAKLYTQLAHMRGMSLPLAIRYIEKAIGYEQYLRSRKDAPEHLEEWMDLLEFLREDAAHYDTVAAWEQAQRAFAKQPGPAAAQTDAACIRLMTVHAAKGLEFDRVYLPDCNEKTYPYGSMPDAEHVEEERRLFYVGMTRAKKDLELLYVQGTKERPRLLTRFLNPIIRQLTHQTRSCPDIRQMHP